MEFRDRLKALREEKGLTHSQVAAAFKKSEGAVRSWEMARSVPDINTLIELAKFFECTTDYLLGLSDYANAIELDREREALDKIYVHLNNALPTERMQLYSVIQTVAIIHEQLRNRDDLRAQYTHAMDKLSTRLLEAISYLVAYLPDDKHTQNFVLLEVARDEKACRTLIDNLFSKISEAIKDIPVSDTGSNDHAET